MKIRKSDSRIVHGARYGREPRSEAQIYEENRISKKLSIGFTFKGSSSTNVNLMRQPSGDKNINSGNQRLNKPISF